MTNIADEIKKRYEREKGYVQGLMFQLKKEFGCNNVEQAKELLSQLEEKLKLVEEEYQTLYERFEKKWKHKLFAND